MRNWLREAALCFSAGCAGALAKGGIIWVCAQIAVTAGFASHLARAQLPPGVYARIVWGGIAALLFLLPLRRGGWVLRGLVWGAVAAAVQLLVIPLWLHAGVHFALMPMLSAVILWCCWGLATAVTLRVIGN